MTKAYKTLPPGTCECWKCVGSGKFYSGGAVVNGKYTGRTGDCFACQGKGYQTPDDQARNRAYWRHNAPRVA